MLRSIISFGIKASLVVMKNKLPRCFNKINIKITIKQSLIHAIYQLILNKPCFSIRNWRFTQRLAASYLHQEVLSFMS
jgi:hypothetical protein